MDRDAILLKSRKWLIVIFTVIVMSLNIAVAAMSAEIADQFAKRDHTDNSTVRSDLILSTAFTEIVCALGIYGTLRQNYRLVKYFILLTAVNTTFSFYISIKVFSLWIVTIINAVIFYNTVRYERILRKALLNNNNSNTGIRSGGQRSSDLSIISDNSLQSVSIREQLPPQYEPPPAYSEVVMKT